MERKKKQTISQKLLKLDKSYSKGKTMLTNFQHRSTQNKYHNNIQRLIVTVPNTKHDARRKKSQKTQNTLST